MSIFFSMFAAIQVFLHKCYKSKKNQTNRNNLKIHRSELDK
jgi:hypothetical protein